MPAADLFDWENADHYTLLGISPLADAGEIRKAYRKLAKLHHPDRYPLDSPERVAAASRFKALSLALEVLSDPEQRATYDSQLDLLARVRYTSQQYQIEIPPRPEPPPAAPAERPAGRSYWDDDDDGGDFVGELSRVSGAPVPPAANRGISDASKRSAANAYYAQGLRYYSYGHYDQAMRSFLLAMQLDPGRSVPPHVWSRLVRYSYGWD